MIPNIFDDWYDFRPITQQNEYLNCGYNIDRWIKLENADKLTQDVKGMWRKYLASLSTEYVKAVKL